MTLSEHVREGEEAVTEIRWVGVEERGKGNQGQERGNGVRGGEARKAWQDREREREECH